MDQSSSHRSIVMPRMVMSRTAFGVPRNRIVPALLLALAPALSGARGLALSSSVRLSDLLLAVAAILGVLRLGRGLIPISRLGVSWLLLGVSVSSLSLLRGGTGEVGTATLALMQPFLVFGLAYVAMQGVRIEQLMLWVVGVASLVAALGVFQFFDVGLARAISAAISGNMDLLYPVNWKIYRATGTFVSWHAYGAYLAVALIVAIALVVRPGLSRWARSGGIAAILLISIGLATSLTVAAFALALVPAGIFLARRSSSLGTVAVLGGAAVVVAQSQIGSSLIARLALQEEGASAILPQTIAYRVQVWGADFIPLVLKEPIFGPGMPNPESGYFTFPESMYIFVLLCGGIVGLALFAAAVFVTLAELRKVRLTEHVPTALSVLLFYQCITFALVMLIHPYFTDAGGGPLFFVMVAALTAAADRGGAETRGSRGSDIGASRSPMVSRA